MVNSIVIVHEQNVIMSGEYVGLRLRGCCAYLVACCVLRGGEPRWYFFLKKRFFILCWVDKVLKRREMAGKQAT